MKSPMKAFNFNDYKAAGCFLTGPPLNLLLASKKQISKNVRVPDWPPLGIENVIVFRISAAILREAVKNVLADFFR